MLIDIIWSIDELWSYGTYCPNQGFCPVPGKRACVGRLGCSNPLVGGPLFTVLFRKVLRVLHELLPVLEVLFGQVAPERVLGLGLVDQRHQRLDDLKTKFKDVSPFA